MIGNNVLQLHTKSVYNDIITYLNNRGLDSERTKDAYDSHIRQFFRLTRNKDLEHLQEKDLTFSRSEILQYKELLSKANSKSTVNAKLSCITTLFDELSITYPQVDMKIFKKTRHKKVQQESWGSLTWEQTEQMIAHAKELPQGEEKSLIIEVAAKTGYRVSEILSITWDKINYKQGYWVISAKTKSGEIEEVPVENELYEKLLSIRSKAYPDNKVFGIHQRTCQRMIKELCDLLGIEENNIKFHSLKKMGINEIYEQTGDIKKASIHGKHSDVGITDKYYIKTRKDYGNSPSLMIGKKIDLSPLSDLSKEELLEIVQNCTNGTKMELLKRLQG